MRARIFNIMQYENHPETGEPLINEEKIIEALKHKSIKKWAYIRHDADVYSEKDEQQNPEHKQGETKPAHWHIVLMCENSVEVSVIAKWFGIPENFVDVPKGGNNAFLDCVIYLTHEDERQQQLGKYHYPDICVKANFDFREAIVNRAIIKAKYGRDCSEVEEMFFDVLYNGKTLEECSKQNELLYIKHIDKLKKLRCEYISTKAEVPGLRISYYIEGKGGIGKNTCAKALAKSLYPDLETPYFEVGGDNVSFEGYDGEPVIIWNDIRAYDLIARFGRGEVFDIFDSHPTTSRHNVKYGSTRLVNTYNIVNGIETYQTFLDSLSGEYTQKDGVRVKAEDKNQAYRRFPIIICLRETDFDVLLNKGVVENTREFLQYIGYKGIKGSFARINEKLSGKAKEVVLLDMTKPMLGCMEKIKTNEEGLIEDIELIPEEFSDYGQIKTVEDNPQIEEAGEIIDYKKEYEKINIENQVLREKNKRLSDQKNFFEEELEKRYGEIPIPFV